MSDFDDEFREDLSEIIGDLPTTFTFSGTIYQGVLSNMDESRTPELGGFHQGAKAQLNVPLYTKVGTSWHPTFATEPRSGDRIVINNGTLQVVPPVVRAPDGNEIILTLDNPS